MDLIDVQDDGAVRVVTLDDPATDNALHAATVAALERAFEVPRAIRAVLLRGRGDVFCSGADRRTLGAVARRELEPADAGLVRGLLKAPVPFVAAMEGHAVGGGLAVGLCADVAVLARESRYGCTFMDLGFTPGMGTTALLEDLVGPALAREMLLGGEALRGDALAAAGVRHVVPRAEVWARATELAARMADKPAAALRALKRALAERRLARHERARLVEALMHEICFADPEVRERLEAIHEG
ncbi:MAG: polyketide synthase [Sandaracinaceae bacterium]